MDSSTSSLRRSERERKKNFTIIYNDLSRDTSISLAARGFLQLLLTYDKSWHVSIPYFIKKEKVSKNKIYKLINELIKAGYMKREVYLERGMKRYEYHFNDFKEFLLCPQNQDTENQDTENEDTIEYQENPYQDSLKEKQLKASVASAPLSVPPSKRKAIKEEKIEVVPFVWLTKTSKEAFLRKCQGDLKKFDRCITTLSDWKISKGKVGGNDYLNLCKWVLDSDEEKNTSSYKSSNLVEENQKKAHAIVARYKNHPQININKEFIEFTAGERSIIIYFRQPDFDEKVKINMKRMKLDFEGIL